ncbi:MAG: hypothetical protein KGS72_13445 [Cyanobacteria bacterium REEB67]|nr:hypothetical protein [Cyanobacteria bacterium REEB67]
MPPKPYQEELREKSPQLRKAAGNALLTASMTGSDSGTIDSGTIGAGTTTFQSQKSTPQPPAELKLGADYEVLKLIGQGGMGCV